MENNEELYTSNHENSVVTTTKVRLDEIESNINLNETSEQDIIPNNGANDLLLNDIIRLEVNGKYAFFEVFYNKPKDKENKFLYANNNGVTYKFSYFQGDDWKPTDVLAIYNINSYSDIAEIIIRERETVEKVTRSIHDLNIIREFYDNFITYQGVSLYTFNTEIFNTITINEHDTMLICDLTIVTLQGEHLTFIFRPELNSIRFGESVVVGENMISIFSLLTGLSLSEIETWKIEKYKEVMNTKR